MAEKIIYKNHCTPQEQADFTTGNDRYYLDSDVGRKLTGTCESKATTTGSLVEGTYSGTISLSSVPQDITIDILPDTTDPPPLTPTKLDTSAFRRGTQNLVLNVRSRKKEKRKPKGIYN